MSSKRGVPGYLSRCPVPLSPCLSTTTHLRPKGEGRPCQSCFPRQETGREQGSMEFCGGQQVQLLGCHPITRHQQKPTGPCRLPSPARWSLQTSELAWWAPSSNFAAATCEPIKPPTRLLVCCTCSRNNVRLKKETPQRRPAPYIPWDCWPTSQSITAPLCLLPACISIKHCYRHS